MRDYFNNAIVENNKASLIEGVYDFLNIEFNVHNEDDAIKLHELASAMVGIVQNNQKMGAVEFLQEVKKCDSFKDLSHSIIFEDHSLVGFLQKIKDGLEQI